MSKTPPPPAAKQLGQTIRTLREKQEFSIEELANKTGHDAGYLTNIELGNSNPTLRMIEDIAQALGLTIFQLFENAGHS